jgi:outer membrane receptor protein involved in Fe transport
VTIQHLARPILSAALILAVAGQTPAMAADTQQISIALPSMPLGDALREVARLSGRNLVVDDRLVAGKIAPAVAGRVSPEEAVQRLLAGSRLSSRTIEGTLVISGPPPRVALSGPHANPPAAEIVVTGTHLRGAPPTSPVITITRRQIDEAAPASTEELMRHLPQNLSAGTAQENFGVTGTGQDITDHGAGVNLRGLGQRATLVLVDGHRVAPSGSGSFVDVSLLPVSAIERVEVLTDGASAIYGSDAVGGVVNFILRDDFRGIEPMLQIGTTTDGGGRELLAGVTAGGTWSGGSALLSYELRDQQPIRAKDRDFTINLPDDWQLVPRETRHSLYGTARQRLGDKLALEVSGLYAARDTTRSFFDASAIPIDSDAKARSLGGIATLDLDLGGSWRTEASASYFRSRTLQRQQQAAALYNRFDTRNSFREFGVKADGNLVELPAGGLKFAVGAATRREHFSSLFETGFNPRSEEDGARTVNSIYGELSLPLFSAVNARDGLQKLVVTAAGRFEHYERIGSTFDPKVGLLWSPVKGLSFRSTYGTSFRAPLLSESFGYYNVFLFPASLLFIDPAKAPPGGVGATLIGNNPGVEPETSRSLSLGVELAPARIRGLRLAATYYDIDFDNRIARPTDQVVVIGDPAFDPIVTLDPALGEVSDLLAGANQILDVSGPGFTDGGATAGDIVALVDARVSNSAKTRTRGLDVVLEYKIDLGRDRLNFRFNANHVFEFDNKLTSTSPWIRTLNTPFHPVEWKGRAGLSWTRGPITAVTFLNYTAPYRDNRGLRSRRVDSFTTVDAGLSLDGAAAKAEWLRRFRLALHVDNLFDADPPRLLPEPGFDRDIGDDPVNATGRGRTVSLQIRGTW